MTEMLDNESLWVYAEDFLDADIPSTSTTKLFIFKRKIKQGILMIQIKDPKGHSPKSGSKNVTGSSKILSSLTIPVINYDNDPRPSKKIPLYKPTFTGPCTRTCPTRTGYGTSLVHYHLTFEVCREKISKNCWKIYTNKEILLICDNTDKQVLLDYFKTILLIDLSDNEKIFKKYIEKALESLFSEEYILNEPTNKKHKKFLKKLNENQLLLAPRQPDENKFLVKRQWKGPIIFERIFEQNMWLALQLIEVNSIANRMVAINPRIHLCTGCDFAKTSPFGSKHIHFAVDVIFGSCYEFRKFFEASHTAVENSSKDFNDEAFKKIVLAPIGSFERLPILTFIGFLPRYQLCLNMKEYIQISDFFKKVANIDDFNKWVLEINKNQPSEYDLTSFELAEISLDWFQDLELYQTKNPVLYKPAAKVKKAHHKENNGKPVVEEEANTPKQVDLKQSDSTEEAIHEAEPLRRESSLIKETVSLIVSDLSESVEKDEADAVLNKNLETEPVEDAQISCTQNIESHEQLESIALVFKEPSEVSIGQKIIQYNLEEMEKDFDDMDVIQSENREAEAISGNSFIWSDQPSTSWAPPQSIQMPSQSDPVAQENMDDLGELFGLNNEDFVQVPEELAESLRKSLLEQENLSQEELMPSPSNEFEYNSGKDNFMASSYFLPATTSPFVPGTANIVNEHSSFIPTAFCLKDNNAQPAQTHSVEMSPLEKLATFEEKYLPRQSHEVSTYPSTSTTPLHNTPSGLVQSPFVSSIEKRKNKTGPVFREVVDLIKENKNLFKRDENIIDSTKSTRNLEQPTQYQTQEKEKPTPKKIPLKKNVMKRKVVEAPEPLSAVDFFAAVGELDQMEIDYEKRSKARVEEQKKSQSISYRPHFVRHDFSAKYVKIGSLGEGGFGHIAVVTHPELNGVQVCRKSYKTLRLRSQGISSFDIESQLLSKMNAIYHPNINRMVNMDPIDKRIYLAKIDGPSIYQWRRKMVKGVFSSEKYRQQVDDASKKITLDLISAIATLHEMQIIHRDLKHDNVMLEVDAKSPLIVKKAILIDLGQGAEIKDCRNYSIKSLLGYAAPETVPRTETDRQCDKAVDMFGLGCLIYFIMRGVHPFQIIDTQVEWPTDNRRKMETKEESWKAFIKSKEIFNPMNEVRRLNTTNRLIENVPKRVENEAMKEVITSLMAYNPEERKTIPELMELRWLKGSKLTKPGRVEDCGRAETAEYAKKQLSIAADPENSKLVTYLDAPLSLIVNPLMSEEAKTLKYEMNFIEKGCLNLSNRDQFPLFKGTFSPDMKSITANRTMGEIRYGSKRFLGMLNYDKEVGMKGRCRFANGLFHPSLLRFICTNFFEGKLLSEFEFFDGTNLESATANRKTGINVPEEDFPYADWACWEIFLGINHLHKLSLIHGDLTTKNVLYKRYAKGQFNIKILVTENVGSRLNWESRKYWPPIDYTTAPEMGAFRIISEKSDFYSIGVLYIKAVCGEEYVFTKGPPDTFMEIKKKSHLVEDMPNPFEAMMAHNPSQRATAEIFISEMEKWLCKELAQEIRQKTYRISSKLAHGLCLNTEDPKYRKANLELIANSQKYLYAVNRGDCLDCCNVTIQYCPLHAGLRQAPASPERTPMPTINPASQPIQALPPHKYSIPLNLQMPDFSKPPPPIPPEIALRNRSTVFPQPLPLENFHFLPPPPLPPPTLPPPPPPLPSSRMPPQPHLPSFTASSQPQQGYRAGLSQPLSGPLPYLISQPSFIPMQQAFSNQNQIPRPIYHQMQGPSTSQNMTYRHPYQNAAYRQNQNQRQPADRQDWNRQQRQINQNDGNIRNQFNRPSYQADQYNQSQDSRHASSSHNYGRRNEARRLQSRSRDRRSRSRSPNRSSFDSRRRN